MEMPNAPVVDQDAIPAAMKRYPHWILWRYTKVDDRWTKRPVNPHTGGSASTTNPETWADFETAVDAVDRWDASGVGFVFSENAPFTGIDIDKAIDADGVISAVPQIVLRGLSSYTELSPSGSGYHIIIKGELPEAFVSSNPGKSGKKTTAYEVYRSRRFFTVTGNTLPEYPQTPKERSNELSALWTVMFPEPGNNERVTRDVPSSSTGPVQHVSNVGGLSDTDIINRACTAANGAKFDSLFHRGDTGEYGGDDSAADLALCNMLAFWTQDPGQIERLVGTSALGRRDKWGREDYRRRTIERALSDQGGTYFGGGSQYAGSDQPSARFSWTADEDSDKRGDDVSVSTTHQSRRLVITRASDIEQTDIQWLWPGWLSLGKICILGGAPGDGKSTISLDLAARLSTGSVAPDGKHVLPACNTIIMASEDGAGDTIAPNLQRFGADMNRIFHISSAMDGDKEDIIFLHDDLDLIEQAVIAHDAKLVIIDPISNYTGNADSNSEKDVRRILMPVKQMAERLNIAILCIMHVSKPGGAPRSALQSLMGSTAFGGVARSVWMNVVVPENPYDLAPEEDEDADPDMTFTLKAEKRPKERVLGVIKSNVDDFPDHIMWVRERNGPVEWKGASAFTVGDILAFSDSKINQAIMLLRARLRDGNEVSSILLEEEAKEEKISLRTFKVARHRLGVKSRKEWGERGGWISYLPEKS